MKPMSLVALSLVLVTGGCFLNLDDPPPPPPDDCSAPGALGGITSIELGAMEESGSMTVFAPWQEGERVTPVVGSQGGSMLGVVLSMRGSNVPACVEHRMRLRLESSGELVAGTSYPVRTYAVTDDIRATTTVWLIFEQYVPSGEALSLTLQVGDLELSRGLVLQL